MKSAVEQLRELRDSLKKQLEADETFVAWLEADEAVRRAEARLVRAPVAEANVPPTLAGHAKTSRRSGEKAVTDAALRIISDYGRPVASNEMMAELERLNLVPNGAVPLKRLRSALSGDTRLRSVQTGPSTKFDRGWWFADKPWPTDRDLPPPPLLAAEKELAPPPQRDEASLDPGVPPPGSP